MLEIINYITWDKIALIFSSGLLVYFLDKYFSRAKVKIRNLSLCNMLTAADGLVFDIENVGGQLTSLEPICTIEGMVSGKFVTYDLHIKPEECKLEPHSSRQIIAWAGDDATELLKMWFIFVNIKLTKGRNVKKRYLNILLKEIGFFRLDWGRFLYKWFGYLPDNY